MDDFYKIASLQDVTFMLCHEIGHGIAGGTMYPYYSYNTPASYVEGESDFFAVECLKTFFAKGYLDVNNFEGITVHEDVKATCKDDNLCKQILLASKNYFWHSITRYRKEPMPIEANFNHPRKKSREVPSY